MLPAVGGDTNALSTNLWVSKQAYNAAKGSLKAQYLYNADRRSGGAAFDPTTDRFDVTLGSRRLSLASGELIDAKGRFVFKTPKGTLPAVLVTVDPLKQIIKLSTKGDNLTDTLPGNLLNIIFLGDRGYQLMEFHDAKGNSSPLSDFAKPPSCWPKEKC